MQQSLSKLISRYQRMNVVVLFVFVVAMLFEFYALHETTQKYEQSQLLIQLIDNYKMHYINLSHEYSDTLTLKDPESYVQYKAELDSLDTTRLQLTKLLQTTRFREYPQVHEYVASIHDLVNASTLYFEQHEKHALSDIKESLSYVEKEFSKPITDKSNSLVTAITDISDNSDYTFTNFLLLVAVQTSLTLAIIFMFNRSANNNIIKPIINISNTIRDIQDRKYISTNYQPSSYLVQEFSALQYELSQIAMGHAEMQAKEQGMRMLQERLEMVPVAAHNIINPISSIKALSEHIEFTYFLEPGVKDHLHDVNNICDGLVRWLRNLLFLFNQTSLNQRSANIKEMIQTAINFSSHTFNKKRLTLSVDTIPDDAIAHIDQDLVEQAISCILTNAAQAVKRESGTIDIKYADEGTAHVLTVVDNGNGLTQKFFDGDTSTTKRAGHGIGVAFARSVAMLHKPPIAINFSNNVGSPGANVKFIIPKQA